MGKKDDLSEFLDIKQLKLFELIYSTGSVSRAADQLDQSQPTVSIWLSKLRKALDDPLFVRTPIGMEPTPRARAIIGNVREALESVRKIAEFAPEFDPKTANQKVRICMSDAAHITLLPHILAYFREFASNMTLEVKKIGSSTGQQLTSGEADLAIGLIPELETGFYQQRLFDQDWVCLVNPKHQKIKNSLSIEEYQLASHISISSSTGGWLLSAALKRHEVERKVVLDLPGFLGLPRIVSTTDLIATLPRQMGETLAKSAGLIVFPCPVPTPSFIVKQHWHVRFHHDPANRWLRSVVAKLFLMDGDRGPRRGD